MWAKNLTRGHDIYRDVVLRASILVPQSQWHAGPGPYCRLPRLPRAVLKRIGSFLGFETGVRLSNARNFARVMSLCCLTDAIKGGE